MQKRVKHENACEKALLYNLEVDRALLYCHTTTHLTFWSNYRPLEKLSTSHKIMASHCAKVTDTENINSDYTGVTSAQIKVSQKTVVI